MATIVNARDVILQATSPRLETVQLPDNFGVDFDNVNGSTKPADNADVTVTAVNGGLLVTGGGIALSGGGSIKGGQTDYATGTGFFLGYSGAAYKFSIGNTTNFLKWTGSGLDIAGNITGVSSIGITGTASFGGVATVSGITFAVVANSSLAASGGVRAYAANAGGGAAFYGTAVLGWGVYGETQGGIGIYAKQVTSTSGTALYAECSNNINTYVAQLIHGKNSGSSSGIALSIAGRYEQSSAGTNDITMTVTSTGSASGAGKFINSANTKEIWLAPSAYAIYSPAGKGKYYVVDGIGPFTGFHPGLLPKDQPFEIGDILVDDEVLVKLDVSNTLGTLKRSSRPCELGCLGVLSETKELTVEVSYELWWQLADLTRSHFLADVNGVGEGCVNVCGEGGNIEKGDLIVTSSLPGKGMRQNDDIVRSYTVAKAREAVVFDNAEQVKSCACVYVSG